MYVFYFVLQATLFPNYYMWLSRTLAALEGLWTLGSYSNLYQHGDCLTGRFLDFMRSFLLRVRKSNCDKDFIYENIALPPSPLKNDLFLKLKDRRLKKRLLMSSVQDTCLPPRISRFTIRSTCYQPGKSHHSVGASLSAFVKWGRS